MARGPGQINRNLHKTAQLCSPPVSPLGLLRQSAANDQAPCTRRSIASTTCRPAAWARLRPQRCRAAGHHASPPPAGTRQRGGLPGRGRARLGAPVPRLPHQSEANQWIRWPRGARKIVQETLGHSTEAITRDTYTHVRRKRHQDAAEKLVTLLPETQRGNSKATGS